MTVQSLVRALGTPVQDASEETFELFAQDLPSQNLGFIDPRAPTLELAIAGRDLTIHQSPSILSSNRAGGTTGAVVWKIAPLFAAWLASTTTTTTTTTTTSPSGTTKTTASTTKRATTKSTRSNTPNNKNNVTSNSYNSDVTNPLFTHSLLTPSSHILELGAGISALPALLLAPHVTRYVLTDQPYVARLVELNLAENLPSSSSSSVSAAGGKNVAKGKGGVKSAKSVGAGVMGGGLRERVVFSPLDWETDAVTPSLTHSPGVSSFDVVVACDCVYNDALVAPFVDTCAAACRLRTVENSAAADSSVDGGDGGEGKRIQEPCVCLVAQQLRDPDVFEAWLERFGTVFDVWRVPREMVGRELGGEAGFVVHLGVLKGEVNLDEEDGEGEGV
ncbi:hypothetical protein C8A05DRAFT_45144 [Staphylotrichum tortipilum]|uniref:Diaminohydroxyphosphoribosylamino-pyrimidine deaminase n=1 Tax=Staphylotrichum tortipilum TaxID=2831512 RepID=A0AAN6RSR6_9PEZI|nr:hypothetical protein C8A05DRAFT_45144 [Staphylotrichum longicolle]